MYTSCIKEKLKIKPSPFFITAKSHPLRHISWAIWFENPGIFSAFILHSFIRSMMTISLSYCSLYFLQCVWCSVMSNLLCHTLYLLSDNLVYLLTVWFIASGPTHKSYCPLLDIFYLLSLLYYELWSTTPCYILTWFQILIPDHSLHPLSFKLFICPA